MTQQINSFLPVHNLLIECCNYSPDNDKLENYVSDIVDWDLFLNTAYTHGVYPLVAKSLKSIINVPSEIKSKLKKNNLEIARRNMMMSIELLKVTKLLKENDIKALAIKGPVLSQIIYGNIAQRQYADLDILMAKNDIYKAGVVLKNAGYISEHSIEFLKNSTLLKVAKDFSIFNSAHNVHIEFHWQLFLERQIKKSKIVLFSPLNPAYQINNQTIPTLKDDENLIFLLLHGSKHMWERIEWIVDIDRFIRLKGESIDWDKLSLMARDMKAEVMFYLGLSISNELFSTPLDQNILAKIKTMKKVHAAQEFILKGMIYNSISNKTTKAFAFKILYKTQLNKDNITAVINHYLSTLFQLKDFDVYMVNLPNNISFLYHFIRLYRLMRFYFFKRM